MLVLTRKSQEAVDIGDNIRVTVIRIGTHQVKLGFDAPPDLQIRRCKVAERIRAAMTEGRLDAVQDELDLTENEEPLR